MPALRTRGTGRGKGDRQDAKGCSASRSKARDAEVKCVDREHQVPLSKSVDAGAREDGEADQTLQSFLAMHLAEIEASLDMGIQENSP